MSPHVDLSRVPQYYHRYIGHVIHEDLDTAMRKHLVTLHGFLQSIPPEKWDHRYAAGKWSVKEMVQHVIDAERIFSYRALCFARKDQTALPGFEENDYALHSKADKRSAENLLEELKAVQKSSAVLFQSFDEEQLDQSGIANNQPIYVKAIGYILIGHALHHLTVLKERYMVVTPGVSAT